MILTDDAFYLDKATLRLNGLFFSHDFREKMCEREQLCWEFGCNKMKKQTYVKGWNSIKFSSFNCYTIIIKTAGAARKDARVSCYHRN